VNTIFLRLLLAVVVVYLLYLVNLNTYLLITIISLLKAPYNLVTLFFNMSFPCNNYRVFVIIVNTNLIFKTLLLSFFYYLFLYLRLSKYSMYAF